jgi:nucleoside phosphorylase
MAMSIREESHWQCPRCELEARDAGIVVPLGPRVCDACGTRLRRVTTREERRIWWHGDINPEVISAALGHDKWRLSEAAQARLHEIFEEALQSVREQENISAALRSYRTLPPEPVVPLPVTSDRETVPMDRATVDVLILTALGKELDAVRDNSGPWRKERDPDTGFEYYLTTAYHGLSIAAAGMTGIGPVRSAVATSAGLAALQPKRVILVGICAGIASEVRLGDVCVSDQIIDYELGKVREGQYTPRWQAWASDAELVRAARMYQDSSWTQTVLTPRPDGSNEQPKAHVGTVLSGSKIIADANIVASLRSMWTQAVGLEMEAGGSAAAAHAHPTHPSFILIKGVCDYADAKKNDDWQSYAADAAGRYAISLLIHRGSSNAFHEPPSPVEVVPLPVKASRTGPAIELGLSRQDLLAILTTGFDLREMKQICFALNLDWEQVPDRDTKTDAAMSIIGIFERRSDLPRLLAYIKDQRPGLLQPRAVPPSDLWTNDRTS